MPRIIAISKNFLCRDWHYKNAPAVLRQRYVRMACVQQYTSKEKCQDLLYSFMPCIARRYLWLRTASIVIKP